MEDRNDQAAYLPSPEEIRIACERLQETWDERERFVRRQGFIMTGPKLKFMRTPKELPGWEPPLVATPMEVGG